MHRRVEQIELSHDSHAYRRTSIDCTPRTSAPGQSATVKLSVGIIPVMLLKKDLLHKFSIRAADGKSLPILTKAQNAQVEEAMLLLLAKLLLSRAAAPNQPQPARTLHQGTKDAIHKVVALDPEGAATAVRTANGPLADPSGSAEPETQFSWLLRQPMFPNLLEDFVHQYLLHVVVPAGGDARVIFKTGLEEEIAVGPSALQSRIGEMNALAVTSPRPRSGAQYGTRREGRIGKARLLPAALLTSLRATFTKLMDGLVVRRSISLPLYQSTSCESYHVEVRVPSELVIDSWEVKRGNNQMKPAASTTYPSEVYLHLLDRKRGPTPQMLMSLRLSSNGMLATLFFMAAASLTIAAGGLLVRFGAQLHAASGVAGSVLVVVPAVYASFLAARSTHPLVEVFSRRARLFMGGIAAINFVDAASLAVYGGGQIEWRGWLWLASSVAFLFITLVSLRARSRSVLGSYETHNIGGGKVSGTGQG